KVLHRSAELGQGGALELLNPSSRAAELPGDLFVRGGVEWLALARGALVAFIEALRRAELLTAPPRERCAAVFAAEPVSHDSIDSPQRTASVRCPPVVSSEISMPTSQARV